MFADDTDTLDESNPPRLAVVAMGGNALLPSTELGTPEDQIQAARRIARAVTSLVREGYRVLAVHGNGPQVGRELLRSEEAANKVPARALQHCVASTQGTMGFLLTQAMRNSLREVESDRPVSTVLTQVLVSPDDDAFENPTKPIGPTYSEWRAKELMKAHGWQMVEDSGRGWRQVVASPRPVDVLDVESVEVLLEAGHLVIAGGGGGVPMIIDEDGELQSVSGVVDKDLTAALLANHLGADILVFLTEVDHVAANFGAPDEKPLGKTHRAEVRALLDDGHFPAGSMGPKIEAALEFLDDGGAGVIITSAKKLSAALADRAGTRITREEHDGTVRRQLTLFPAAGMEDAPSPPTT
jgi:carbamate kinase